MPTFQGTTFATFFKRILQINQSSNTGVDATKRSIQTGDGNPTCVLISDDQFSILPQTDNDVGTFIVHNNAGGNILKVDTTNSKVLVGASQVAANTQYAYFGCSSSMALGAVAGTHYLIPFSTMVFTTAAVAFGTGTDPSTSYDISANNNGDDVTVALWFVPDNITIDQVYLFTGGSAASGDTVNIHLMSFDIDKGAGAGKGDLSNGTVIAGGADIASLGYENIIYQATSPSSANVDAGKVIVATFESNGTNSDYGCNIIIKYHIR